MSLTTRWWNKDERDTDAVLCGLCIHACAIPAGRWGYCRARRNDGGELVSPYLGRFISIAVDPIEKKPLCYWRPRTFIFSVGSLGCTMKCQFCQNHTITQPGKSAPARGLTEMPPEKLVAEARRLDLHAVAYTYNEPTLQAEYILSAAPLLRENGIATVLVSNGMFSEELLHELTPVVDAVNIDLKTFNPETYAKLGGSLDAVKRTISHFINSGVHVETTTLVVPGISDAVEDFAEELDWLASLSPDIPLHISRYRPAHKFTAPPTDLELLQEFSGMAKEKLRHVRIGNVPILQVETS